MLAVVVALGVAAATTTGAEPPRARVLTYDAATQQWVEQPPPPPGTAEGDLYEVRERITEGEYGKALAEAVRFVKNYGKFDAWYPEVLTARAQALIGKRDYQKAHKVLQEFLNEFGGMAHTPEALRLEFVVAEAFLKGVKRRFLGIPMLSGVDLAYGILDQIAADYPQERIAEYAIKTKADHLFSEGEHALAELEYSRLLKDYPLSQYGQFALRRSADAALASFRGVEYDDSALVEAEERYRDYRTRYTVLADREGVGLILDDIREKRAEKEFTIGAYYERTGHLSSAVFYYRLVLKDWPTSIAASKATNRLELLGASETVADASREPTIGTR
ncbi:MAG: outer membrane protein assembly factor BamD [Planctomycetes bacterium]|nr:outer membrane protein assembly factor BamD [Planctomycetota bacterium]